MKYETLRIHGKTPSETLLICDNCQRGQWIAELYPVNVHVCSSCNTRQRLATPAEKEEALKCLNPLHERESFWHRTFYKNWRSMGRRQPKAKRKLKMRSK